MKIKTFTSRGYYANCYLISEKNQAIVIDPCVDREKLIPNLKEDNLKLVGIFLTHGHFDHFSNLDTYLNDDCKIYMHKKAYPKLTNSLKNYSYLLKEKIEIAVSKDQVVLLNDKEKISLLSEDILCLETPGHTDCSITLVIADKMFTGDTLFKESVGRTDLPSGNQERLSTSLQKICSYKDDYAIYPGHGEVSTLEHEKSFNPFINGRLHV